MERVEELSGDLNLSQLKDKVTSFIAFSIALDESTDVTDNPISNIYSRSGGFPECHRGVCQSCQ